MKYIRIDADRILAYNEKVKDIDLPFILSQPGHIIKGPVDTIEELFDELVLVKNNYKTLLELEANRSVKNGFLKDIKTGWLSFIDDYLEQDCELYGAIWTDKGLKYIAKMNKEGKFELLC